MRISFEVRPGRTLKLLLILVAVLAAAALAGVYLKHVKGDPMFFRFVPLFDMDREGSVPNCISTLLFAVSAVLLWKIAAAKLKAGDRTGRLWGGLAVVFALFTVDDGAAIHESFVNSLRDTFHAGGYLYFAWVIPALIILVLITPVLFRIWLSLPGPTRLVLALAAIFLVGGALGLEMIEGRYVERWGHKTPAYSLLATLEETMEFIGQVLFLYGLLLIVRAQPEPAPAAAGAVPRPGPSVERQRPEGLE